MALPGPEGPPIPAEATGVSSEVRRWAEEQLGLAKPLRRNIVNVSSGLSYVDLRVASGADVSGIDPEQIILLDSMGREAAWIDQQYEERLPKLKTDIGELASELGVLGLHRDPDHGNFNVNAIPQREVEFDDPTIKESIGQERVGEVYVPKTTITLVFEGDLETADGALNPSSALRTIKYALLGAGVDESLLTERLSRRTEEARRNRELAQLIVDGVPVRGVRIGMVTRVEIDDVDKHRPIKVTRSRRRRLKGSRG